MSDVSATSTGAPAPSAMLDLQRVHLLGDDLADEWLTAIGMTADALEAVLAPPTTGAPIGGTVFVDDVENIVVEPVDEGSTGRG